MDRDFWSWFVTCLFGSFVLTCFIVVLTDKPLVRSEIAPKKSNQSIDISEDFVTGAYLPQSESYVLLGDVSSFFCCFGLDSGPGPLNIRLPYLKIFVW